MSVRFYQISWLIFIVVAAAFFFSGNLTPVVGIVFGFIVFGFIFMGMMSVLPTSITHPAPANERLGAALRDRIHSKYDSGMRHLHDWRASLMSSSSIEVRRPKFH